MVQFPSTYWLILFSKEFCQNLGNALTNRKKGIKIQKRIIYALSAFKSGK
jgi:hypothetical protein